MKVYSFYDKATGLFLGRTYGNDEGDPKEHQRLLDLHTPQGAGVVPGQHDHESMRVDLETGQVIDYQPPAPSTDHEWVADSRRWMLNADAQTRATLRLNASSKIQFLESTQHRMLREITLGKAGAAARLQGVDDQIAVLRAQL